MNRAEKNASSVWWGQTIAVVQWPVVHFHSLCMFLQQSWYWETVRSWSCAGIYLIVGQVPPTAGTWVVQTVETLLRQVLAPLWSRHFFHISQIPFAQRWDQGTGRELGSAAGCQHLNASQSYMLPVSSFLFVVWFIISKYVSTVYYRSWTSIYDCLAPALSWGEGEGKGGDVSSHTLLNIPPKLPFA